jgi:hypothetical protein
MLVECRASLTKACGAIIAGAGIARLFKLAGTSGIPARLFQGEV